MKDRGGGGKRPTYEGLAGGESSVKTGFLGFFSGFFCGFSGVMEDAPQGNNGCEVLSSAGVVERLGLEEGRRQCFYEKVVRAFRQAANLCWASAMGAGEGKILSARGRGGNRGPAQAQLSRGARGQYQTSTWEVAVDTRGWIRVTTGSHVALQL